MTARVLGVDGALPGQLTLVLPSIPAPIPPGLVARTRELRAAGRTLAAIATDTGMSLSAVGRLLRWVRR